jgi:hypothetical protein
MRIWGKNMNNKILIGSIIAIAVLIGVSFTSVVGYKSVTSDVKASPLFNIRCSRAIDEKSGDLSCEYVGKGEEIEIPIPMRDSRIVFLKKFIDRVSKMDDKELNMLKTSFINLIMPHQKDNINNTIDELFNDSLYTYDSIDFCCTFIFGTCPFSMNYPGICLAILVILFWPILLPLLPIVIISVPLIIIMTIFDPNWCEEWTQIVCDN